MAEKRKISIRKVLQVLTTVVVSTLCIIAMVSASGIEDKRTVAGVAIHIQNDKKYHFIEQNEIMDLAINDKNIDVTHTPLSRLDLHDMEKTIMADPWVAHAQVFIDNEHVLQMYVTQRIPVARIFQQNSQSYYMDSTLSIMPLTRNNIYYTTVVTNVPELKNDSAGWALKKDIVSLVSTLQADSFWNAQVSHVVVDSDASFELIPVLGDHRILLGNTDMMRDKLNNLFAFYKNVLNRIGWDKYQTLDVRFKGQVVASPSLPYKGPVDKAIDKMNWINSIVETEAWNDTRDSIKHTEVKKPEPAKKQEKIVAKKAGKPEETGAAHAKPAVKKVPPPAAKKDAVRAAKANVKKEKPAHGGKEKKPAVKGKNEHKNDKKDIKDKKQKQDAPKYVYPEKKNG